MSPHGRASSPKFGSMPYYNNVEATKPMSHAYAIEGSCFVLVASHTQTELGLRANDLIPETSSTPILDPLWREHRTLRQRVVVSRASLAQMESKLRRACRQIGKG